MVLVAGDLADDAIPKELIEAAISNFEKLDVLVKLTVVVAQAACKTLSVLLQVNNAGISLEQPIMQLTVEGFDKIYNVNLRATLALSLLSLPHLVKTKGNIVNVSSVASYRPVNNFQARF